MDRCWNQFSQEFVDEMKHRAKCLEMEDNRDFGSELGLVI